MCYGLRVGERVLCSLYQCADIWLVSQRSCVAAFVLWLFLNEVYCPWNHTGPNCRALAFLPLRAVSKESTHTQCLFASSALTQHLDCFYVRKYSRPLGIQCFFLHPSVQMYNLLHRSCRFCPVSAGCIISEELRSKLSLLHLQQWRCWAVPEYITSANRPAQTRL